MAKLPVDSPGARMNCGVPTSSRVSRRLVPTCGQAYVSRVGAVAFSWNRSNDEVEAMTW